METGIKAKMLTDFPSLSQYLLRQMEDRFGFDSAYVFMKRSSEDALVSVDGQTIFPLSARADKGMLVEAFFTGELLMSTKLSDISSNLSRNEEQTSRLYLLLPLQVANKSIGVFLLATQQLTISDQEKSFLQQYADEISLPLLTAWELSNSSSALQQLQEVNQDYRGLIEVKQIFLEQVEEILSLVLQQSELSEEKRAELISALSYLQSVLLLSKKTLGRKQKKE